MPVYKLTRVVVISRWNVKTNRVATTNAMIGFVALVSNVVTNSFQLKTTASADSKITGAQHKVHIGPHNIVSIGSFEDEPEVEILSVSQKGVE